MDEPRIRVIPEWFGAGALPRKELREAAEQLTAEQAGLLVVSSEPVIEKEVDKALTGAGRVAKHKVDARIDQVTSELREALKRWPRRAPSSRAWRGTRWRWRNRPRPRWRLAARSGPASAAMRNLATSGLRLAGRTDVTEATRWTSRSMDRSSVVPRLSR